MDHLAGCKERVERAREHLKDLYTEWDSWDGTQHEFVVEHELGGGWHSFTTKYFEAPSLRFGVLVSDFLHQLRATLDNLVCALAELNGTPCARNHAFPVALKEADWLSALSGRLNGLRSDHIAAIQSVQPYARATEPLNHPLAGLDELSRLDRHRFLTPTPLYFANGLPEIAARADEVIIQEVQFTPGTPLEVDREFLRVRVEPPDAAPDLNLSGGSVYLSFGDRPINAESLERIGGLVDELVNRPIFQS